MKNIRMSVLLLACWLIFIFYSEALLAKLLQVDILQTGFAALLFIALILTLTLPHFHPVVDWLVLGTPAVLLFLLRSFMGMFGDSSLLAYTMIDVCALVIATALTHRVRLALDAFEAAVIRMTFGREDRAAIPERSGASYLYREVRRARNHQRPFALMAVAVDETSGKLPIDRMVQEVQMAMMKQFSLAGVSRTLCESLEDCAVIVQENDHFLVALPETKAEEMPVIINRLRKQVSDRVGVSLLIGAATLPKDGYTFEGLVASAKEAMKPGQEPLNESNRLSVEKPLTQ